MAAVRTAATGQASTNTLPPSTPSKRRRALLAVLALAVGLGLPVTAVCAGWLPQPEWLSRLRSPGAERGESGEGESAVTPVELEGISYTKGGHVDFGPFDVTMFDPGTGNSLKTTFRLKGNLHDDDERAFWSLMGANHRAFDEQVDVTVRNCDVEDLLDPDLRLLRKRLVARINRGLGVRLLEAVRIEDYKVYESLGGMDWVPRELPAAKSAVPPAVLYDPHEETGADEDLKPDR